jgi:hypothetical protein
MSDKLQFIAPGNFGVRRHEHPSAAAALGTPHVAALV